jgi:hypothetical protein
MFNRFIVYALCVFALSACFTPKECTSAKKLLLMPPDFSTLDSAAYGFGGRFQTKLEEGIADRFKDITVSSGYAGEDSDIIVRTVFVEYSSPDFRSDSLAFTGTGNVGLNVRIFSGDGKLLRETFIMRDLKSGTENEVLNSMVEEAVKFIDRKCL